MKLMVAISYGKGVIECEQYEHLDGKYFANYVRRKFPTMFKKSNKFPSRLWVQDGDPSQNCGDAKKEMKKIGAELFNIPAKSPDLNPIENVFHLVRRKLAKQALAQNITKESYAQFSERVKDTLLTFDSHIIDKTIDTMSRRINMIITTKGHRTKY